LARKARRRSLEGFREIRDLVESLNYRVDAVLVEGRHDAETLRRLGFRGRIVRVSDYGAPLVELAYEVSKRTRSVAVLTDFDEKGELIARKLTAVLQELGVRINYRAREEFREVLAKHGLRTIESIASLAPRRDHGL